MFDLQVTQPPAGLPVSLAEARAWLRLGSDGDDAVLAWMIGAATARFEVRTAKALIQRTVRERFWPLPNGGNAGCLVLHPGLWPVTTIASVSALDARGSEQVIPVSAVRIGTTSLTISVPRAGWSGLELTYDAGAATSDGDVDGADKAEVLHLVSALYASREAPERALDPVPDRLVRL